VSAAAALVLTSGSSLALLGVAAARLRSATRARRAAAASLQRERYVLHASQTLVAASRRSSAAVFDALKRTLQAGCAELDAFLAFVPDGSELSCAYAAGPRCEHFRHARLLRSGASLPAIAARGGARAVSYDERAAVLPTDRFALAVPILDSRRLRAVAYASSPAAGCACDVDALVRAIEAAAIPYAIAVERESDRSDALHDGLTGLLAPRPFRRRIHEEIARIGAAGSKEIVSLWFVDTDRFKAINDRFGHRAGDAVLQTMASLLQAHLTPGSDVAARNGGDEFCALLRTATKQAAIDRARRFCAAVREHEFAVPVQITASVGVASYPYDASTSSELLEAASSRSQQRWPPSSADVSSRF
jgi:diguanylate cyclase (GGDEF)-like protein